MATKDFNTATLTAKTLFANTTTTTTGTGDAVYTVPVNRCAKIATMNLCSIHSSNITVDVYVVPSGATPGNQHKVVSARTMMPGETLGLQSLVAGLMLGDSDIIKVKPSVSSVCNVFLSGVEGV